MKSCHIKFSDDGIIEIEGVKITIAVIPDLVNPPTDALFSFRRVDDYIEVTRYVDAEAATKFFKKWLSNEIIPKIRLR